MGIDYSTIINIAIIIGTILFSVTLHEIMHGYVALKLGDDTAYLSGRLTLNPLKHIDPFATILLPLLLALSGLPPFGAAKPVPINPTKLQYDEYGSALVAIAGPATNFVLAILSGLWLRFVIGFDAGPATEYTLLFMIVNLAFGIFNLIPFPPLDGSRILYAVAPDGLREFMRTIERGGLFAIGLFIIFAYSFLGAFMTNLINLIGSFILGVELRL